MNLDEILDRYEDLWRGAALAGTRQGRAPAGQSSLLQGGDCAWSIGGNITWTEPLQRPVQWHCPECGAPAAYAARVMMHLNDVHGWTWDTFANKFRDALSRGASPEAKPRP